VPAKVLIQVENQTNSEVKKTDELVDSDDEVVKV
jgi:hypothetical protein